MSNTKKGRFALYPLKDTDRIPSHINISVSSTEIILQHETLPQKRLHLTAADLIWQVRRLCVQACNTVNLNPLEFYDDTLEYNLSCDMDIPRDESDEIWLRLQWEPEKEYWLLYITKIQTDFLIFMERQQMIEFANLFDWDEADD